MRSQNQRRSLPCVFRAVGRGITEYGPTFGSADISDDPLSAPFWEPQYEGRFNHLEQVRSNR
jgi:hypothetical protein